MNARQHATNNTDEMASFEDVDMFPELGEPIVPEPERRYSTDRRRTQRQRDDVARGVHPLVGGPLSPDPDAKCGNCVHRIASSGHHSWPKCDLTNMAHSAASDCRAWWPGCLRHERAV